MTETQIRDAFARWSGNGTGEELFQPGVPIGNFDVAENAEVVVNRLYYAVPRFAKGHLRCFFYYEENIFRKDKTGNLSLVCSQYGVDN